MNKIEGERMNDIFYKYYNKREVDKEDIDMLDKLLITGLIEYRSSEDFTPYAQATSLGRGLFPNGA
ncbi:MAG: hypothetical protein FWD37_05665 [Methanomassiliicoccaceae archaeon]|nr:hypothetical protein [Methanomassiliicoccaceae archaeon]